MRLLGCLRRACVAAGLLTLRIGGLAVGSAIFQTALIVALHSSKVVMVAVMITAHPHAAGCVARARATGREPLAAETSTAEAARAPVLAVAKSAMIHAVATEIARHALAAETLHAIVMRGKLIAVAAITETAMAGKTHPAAMTAIPTMTAMARKVIAAAMATMGLMRTPASMRGVVMTTMMAAATMTGVVAAAVMPAAVAPAGRRDCWPAGNRNHCQESACHKCKSA